jgi:hypothetical protein
MQVSIAVSSVSDPDLDWTQIQSGRGSGIRIWIQEGKHDPHKYKKLRIFLFRSAGCYLWRAEGFSCSFDVLYKGLGISKLQFLKEKNIKFIGSGLDPDPDGYSA